MLSDEIKKVVIEYKEFCDGSFGPENAIKYIYNNVVYDYDVVDQDTKDELKAYITSLFENDISAIKRIIIAGSTEFNDYAVLEKVASEVIENEQAENIEIVSGHAKGADSLGELYASNHKYKCTIFSADWAKYGRAAGPIRNKQMLDYAKKENPILIAFWNGTSKGTKNMISIANKDKVKTITYNYLTHKYTDDTDQHNNIDFYTDLTDEQISSNFDNIDFDAEIDKSVDMIKAIKNK